MDAGNWNFNFNRIIADFCKDTDLFVVQKMSILINKLIGK